jgi:hypothetical protein
MSVGDKGSLVLHLAMKIIDMEARHDLVTHPMPQAEFQSETLNVSISNILAIALLSPVVIPTTRDETPESRAWLTRNKIRDAEAAVWKSNLKDQPLKTVGCLMFDQRSSKIRMTLQLRWCLSAGRDTVEVGPLAVLTIVHALRTMTMTWRSPSLHRLETHVRH